MKRIKQYINVIVRLGDVIFRAIDYGIACLKHKVKGFWGCNN